MSACRGLQIPQLILYHTEEMHLKERKELYTREGQEYYHGKLFVPDDLEGLSFRVQDGRSAGEK